MAVQAHTTNVIPFRRPANDQRAALVKSWDEAREAAAQPDRTMVISVILAAMVTGMTDRARLTFYARFQKMYDQATGRPERQELVRLAAECIDAPLKTSA